MTTIRPYRADDAEAVFAAVDESRNELMPWLPWCNEAYSIEDTRKWLEAQISGFSSGTAYSFAICDHEGQFLGACGLSLIEKRNRVANLGFWVRRPATRRGVASEAVRQLVAWAFANTDFERLEVLVSVENVASKRVAEKSGAVPEGLLRHRIMLCGRSHDCVMYSFIRDDLKPA
jgi:RimJ/RimL family protein N-acetyltransferase